MPAPLYDSRFDRPSSARPSRRMALSPSRPASFHTLIANRRVAEQIHHGRDLLQAGQEDEGTLLVPEQLAEDGQRDRHRVVRHADLHLAQPPRRYWEVNGKGRVSERSKCVWANDGGDPYFGPVAQIGRTAVLSVVHAFFQDGHTTSGTAPRRPAPAFTTQAPAMSSTAPLATSRALQRGERTWRFARSPETCGGSASPGGRCPTSL